MKLFYVCTPTLMVLPEIKRLWIPNTSEMAFMEPLKTMSPLNYVYPRVTLRSGSQAEDGDWMMEPCFSFLFDPSTHYIGILGFSMCMVLRMHNVNAGWSYQETVCKPLQLLCGVSARIRACPTMWGLGLICGGCCCCCLFFLSVT